MLSRIKERGLKTGGSTFRVSFRQERSRVSREAGLIKGLRKTGLRAPTECSLRVTRGMSAMGSVSEQANTARAAGDHVQEESNRGLGLAVRHHPSFL